jgi:hypothetical protein
MNFEAVAKGPINTYSLELDGDIPEGTIITDINNKEKKEFNANEKFKLLIPITNISKDGNFNIKVGGLVNTKPILYGKSPNSSQQDYALTGSNYEEGLGTKKVYYNKNLTKITILKQETDTEVPIQGVEFDVLDENEETIHTSLVTDEKGEIVLENLLPGKYYIKETKTLEGYLLYDKLIEVELGLNETAKIIVNNGEEVVDFEIDEPKSVKEVGNKERLNTVKLPKTGM